MGLTHIARYIEIIILNRAYLQLVAFTKFAVYSLPMKKWSC
jgi:hypothetical protein